MNDDGPGTTARGTATDLVRLDDPAATRADLVGEKFASLARARVELADIEGVVVPDAVAVTPSAVQLAIEGRLDERLAQELARLTGGPSGTRLLAVRSSSSSEDLPGASHAGVYDSVLGVRGIDELRHAIETVAESANGPRARAYRGSDEADATMPTSGAHMAVIVQRQVRADLGGWSGVVFSHDPESGGAHVVIEAVAGLGAPLVSGQVDPQRWQLRDGELTPEGTSTADGPPAALLQRVAELASTLARVRDTPVDVEWAVERDASQLAVVQIRPLRVAADPATGPTAEVTDEPTGGSLGESARPGTPLVEGLAVGRGTTQGQVLVVHDPDEVDELEPGTVLVVHHTDPRWMHLLHQAAALVTDVGGRTSHAAIVARELGLLGVLGCGDATTLLSEVPPPRTVHVQCRDDGVGLVYRAEHVG